MTPGSSIHSESALLVDLFGGGVHTAASDLLDRTTDLLPAEHELVSGVARKRKLEISTGRMLARRLLAGLGHPDFPLLQDRDRVPIWPKDVVGSISHKEGLCVVAVASSPDRAGIGIDIEPDRPVKSGLERLVCVASERDWVAAEGASALGRRCRAVFSAKEAVYKTFFPRVRELWGFKDVEVFIDFADGSFRAKLPPSAPRIEVDGRILRRDGWILSAVDDQ